MPEFGVRLALGCDGAELWRRVVFDQLRIVGVGAASASDWRRRRPLLASMLPEPVRLAVVTGAVALLVATAAVSAAIPASRVLRLNPLATATV